MRKLTDMSEAELINHYSDWWFDKSLKDGVDMERMLKRLIRVIEQRIKG